ncbi:RlpA-like double-psi beta-barrel-protein domain-containing protein-containing protein [Mycena latifolia]|nr:RlpA-like double-psi beta-barrel-protein domain-containing protein-containing protein [Mycena latifolia]
MLSLLSLLFFSTVTVAAHNITLSGNFKRGTSSKFSNYFAGQGACGWFNTDSEFVVALTALEWNNGANCGKEISISWQGKSTTAKIVDECMDCPENGLDFSQSLFSFFVGEGNNEQVGIIYGDWSYVSSGGGSDETATTTTKAQQKTTTTSTSTSTTSTMTSSTTTSKATTSSVAGVSITSSSATSVLPSLATKSSATAAAPPQMTGLQNLGDFNQAILTLSGLIVEAQALK